MYLPITCSMYKLHFDPKTFVRDQYIMHLTIIHILTLLLFRDVHVHRYMNLQIPFDCLCFVSSTYNNKRAPVISHACVFMLPQHICPPFFSFKFTSRSDPHIHHNSQAILWEQQIAWHWLSVHVQNILKIYPSNSVKFMDKCMENVCRWVKVQTALQILQKTLY